MVEFADPGWLLAGVAALVAMAWRARHHFARRERRAGLTFSLRGLGLALLAIALAGPLSEQASQRVDVVFALDVSKSIGPEVAREALNLVNQAIETRPEHASVGVVAFGGQAGVERLIRDTDEPIEALASDVAPGNTDIARALEVSVAAFAGGGQRRVVLLSDGQENLGRARAAAQSARALGVRVHTMALDRARQVDDIRAEGIRVPRQVRAHEPFEVDVLVRASGPTAAELVLMRNGAVIVQRTVDLTPGVNSHSVVEQVPTPGLYEYDVVVTARGDEVGENNRYQAFVRVDGPAKILHLVDSPEWGAPVRAALRAQGLSVDEVPGDALPLNLHGLAEYDLIILDNISGFSISTAKMQRLEEYVRDLGGGVVVLGGEHSYGGGGYHGTPLERLLPVSMDVATEARIPNLSVTIVLDRSGSMATDDKLYIAKSAALAAIDVLHPVDQVAVLTFDDVPKWRVPPTRVGERATIAARLRDIDSGGGTDLYRALESALESFREDDAKVRHLIILSDGLTDTDQDFEALVGRLAAARVTVSAVAFGADADQALLESVAAWGAGRYYYTDDPGNVPRIFTSETLVVSRELHVEAPTAPQLRFAGGILDGFAAADLPELAGYQRTFAKPQAQILLSGGAEDDPLLVSWRYGSGKSVAFMSDISQRWGQAWAAWEAFPRFVGQLARWTMRQRSNVTAHPNFERRDGKVEVTLDLLDSEDRLVNQARLRASAIGPDREPQAVSFDQVAPGRYRGVFAGEREGRYYLSVSGSYPGESDPVVRTIGPLTFGFAVPYSPEFVARGADHERLAGLAEAGGGEALALSPQSLDPIFAMDAEAVRGADRVWWWWLLLALALLVVETAVRKLPLPARWLGADGAERVMSAFERRWAAERQAHLQALASEDEVPEQLAHGVRARLYHAGETRRRA